MSDQDDEILTPPPVKDRKKIAISVRCGECLFFSKHSIYDKPCSELGESKDSRVCDKFMPNVHEKMNKDLLDGLLRNNSNTLKLIAGIIYNELRSRAANNVGYGDEVYFRFIGDDYLTNYVKATVMSSSDSHYFLMCDKGKFQAMVLKSSVIPASKWAKKRAALQKHGKLADPNFKKFFRVSATSLVKADYVPPTLDDNLIEKVKSSSATSK